MKKAKVPVKMMESIPFGKGSKHPMHKQPKGSDGKTGAGINKPFRKARTEATDKDGNQKGTTQWSKV